MRVLLIGESAPDPGDAERRFFYAPILTQHDALFRGVVEAFYRCSPGSKGDPKAPWLDRLKADGVFLIDLVPFPINALAFDKSEAERLRSKARKDHVAACIDEVQSHDPAGVIICHDGVYKAGATKMRAAGLPLLHNESIPFPLYGGVSRFPVAVRAALDRLETGLG
ncbi:MAG: hypothetical protein M3417_16480 [Actinomycetota bacterium]|nr:hypothetical protein [Actinomycetota bacterium]